MRKKQYTKPQIKRKKITVQFFSRNEYRPNSDMEVILLAQTSGGGACILPHTKVMLSDNNKQISVASLKEGDVVLSYDNKKRIYVKNVVKKIAIHKNEISEYFLINKRLAITGNHLLLINETDWKMVQDLRIGDILHTYDNTPEPINSIELIKKQAPVVYNVELEKTPGNYLAEGICIHW